MQKSNKLVDFLSRTACVVAMANEVIFYTQVASIVSFLSTLFVLYRSLISQKDAVIELLKERLDLEKDKLEDLRNQAPDALVETLDKRVQVMQNELERLKKDGDAASHVIVTKELEIQVVRNRLLHLIEVIQDSDLVCPKCGSPVVKREARVIYGSIGDKDVDAEVEYREYECGALFEDCACLKPCPRSANNVST